MRGVMRRARHRMATAKLVLRAHQAGESEDWEQAAVLFTELAAAHARGLGAADPATLRARADAAFTTGQSGEVDDALTLYGPIVEDLAH